jgi:hypothetical protein
MLVSFPYCDVLLFMDQTMTILKTKLVDIEECFTTRLVGYMYVISDNPCPPCHTIDCHSYLELTLKGRHAIGLFFHNLCL